MANKGRDRRSGTTQLLPREIPNVKNVNDAHTVLLASGQRKQTGNVDCVHVLVFALILIVAV